MNNVAKLCLLFVLTADSDPRDPEVKASYKVQLEMYKQEKASKSAKWEMSCVNNTVSLKFLLAGH